MSAGDGVCRTVHPAPFHRSLMGAAQSRPRNSATVLAFLVSISSCSSQNHNVLTLAGVARSSGSTNGIGTNAQFTGPDDVAISPDGSFALVADPDNGLIRHIVLSTSAVSTIAGGDSSGSAQLNGPSGIAISPDGSSALFTDSDTHLIRHLALSTSAVSTVAGVAGSSGSTDGIGTSAQFNGPNRPRLSPDGSYALVADKFNHLIRQIVLSTSAVSTVAGVAGSSGSTNGFGTNSKFFLPDGLAISPDGSYALVGDTNNHLIRRIVLSTSAVSTVAGVAGTSGSTNGIGTNANFLLPISIAISPDGSYALVADTYNNLIRQIILSTSSVSLVVGSGSGSTNGIGTNAEFDLPVGLAISPDGSYALVADYFNSAIRQITFSWAPTVAPTPGPTVAPTFQPSAPPACPPGHFLKIPGDSTSCAKCEEGYYSNSINEDSCHRCDSWEGNTGRGNSDCPYFTAANSSLDVIPILFCVLYGLLSLICFALVVYLGASPTVFLNFLLITTDQVTDILYSWYSLFVNPFLFWLSVIFCLANLLPPMLYFLWYSSLVGSLVFQWQIKVSEYFHRYDMAHGDGEETSGWIFHVIQGWRFGESFPFSLIFIPIDGLWIALRIAAIVVTFFSSLLCQLTLLVIGVIFSVTKLMSVPVVENWFWSNWNLDYLETYPRPTDETAESAVVYNSLVLLEVFSECLPQLIIQSINASLVSKKVDVLTVLSITASASMIMFILYHFWYKHRQLLRNDPTYTSFDITRIPKFDMYEKLMITFQNKRKKPSQVCISLPSSSKLFSWKFQAAQFSLL
jgi:DNA-binding beta-propeller fold protein YncE